MAQLKDLYLPSLDSPERTWRIGYFKPDRRPGVVSAYEGELNHETGWQSWTCDMFGCRKYRRELPGRATKRAVAQGLAALLTEMRDTGVIPPERADHYIAQALQV